MRPLLDRKPRARRERLRQQGFTSSTRAEASANAETSAWSYSGSP